MSKVEYHFEKQHVKLIFKKTLECFNSKVREVLSQPIANNF